MSLIEHRYMGGDLGDSGCDGGLTDHTAYTGQTLMSAAEQQSVPIFINRPVFVSSCTRFACLLRHAARDLTTASWPSDTARRRVLDGEGVLERGGEVNKDTSGASATVVILAEESATWCSARDLPREQIVSTTSVDKCGKDCELWMQEH